MPRFATGPLRRLSDTMTCPANLSLTMTPSNYRYASQSGAASHWKLYCFGQQTRNDSMLTPSNYRGASQSCAASPWKLYCLRGKSRNDKPTRRAYQSDGRWRVWSSARPKYHRLHHDIMWQVTLIINSMSRHSIRYNSFLVCCHLWCSLDVILLNLVILCPSDMSEGGAAWRPDHSQGRILSTCIHDNIILIIVHNIHASTTPLCSVRSFLSMFSPE